MAKVWLVSFYVEFEGSDVQKVFSSEVKAVRYATEENIRSGYLPSFEDESAKTGWLTTGYYVHCEMIE